MDVTWSARADDQDEAIARFLRENPAWLAAHPELYRVLAPPARVYGEAMADHMAAMVVRERLHAEAMTEQAEAILAAGRAAATLLARVHEAVLALVVADDVLDCLWSELPRILAVDALCLCRRGGSSFLDQNTARLEGLLNKRDFLFRSAPADARTLYREAASLARSDVLIRLPAVGVLGLASRDDLNSASLSSQVGLMFLGRAVAALMQRMSRGERDLNFCGEGR
jgi:uncharacterized protein YigA (DUF484 family)